MLSTCRCGLPTLVLHVSKHVFYDQAEIAWFRAVSDGRATSEDLDECGEPRHSNLDRMLALELNAKLDHAADFARVVKKKPSMRM